MFYNQLMKIGLHSIHNLNISFFDKWSWPMNSKIILFLVALLYPVGVNGGEVQGSKINDLIEIHSLTNSQAPIGKQGLMATYLHESGSLIPGSVVRDLTLALRSPAQRRGAADGIVNVELY
jgi:hypothetical protein